MGVLYEYQGRYREAISYFEMAVELEPLKYERLGNLADAYRLDSRKSSDAEAAYSRQPDWRDVELRVNEKDALLEA